MYSMAVGVVSRKGQTSTSLSVAYNDDDDVTNDGRLFHARAAATGKVRSPIRRVARTMTAGDELEHSLHLVSTSATRLMLSARYTGAVPLMDQWRRV